MGKIINWKEFFKKIITKFKMWGFFIFHLEIGSKDKTKEFLEKMEKVEKEDKK